MAVFLFLEKLNEEKAKIMCVHYRPELLSESDKQNGVLVDSYVEPEYQSGKIALPYWNYNTQEVFFEFIDAPKQNDEKVLELEGRLALMQQAMDEMIMGGMF